MIGGIPECWSQDILHDMGIPAGFDFNQEPCGGFDFSTTFVHIYSVANSMLEPCQVQSPSSHRTPRLQCFLSVSFVRFVGLQFGGLLQEKTRFCLAFYLLKLCRLAMTRRLTVKALRQMTSHLKWDQSHSLSPLFLSNTPAHPTHFWSPTEVDRTKGLGCLVPPPWLKITSGIPHSLGLIPRCCKRSMGTQKLEHLTGASNSFLRSFPWSVAFVGIVNDSRHLRLSRCPTGARFLASLWIVCGHFAPRLEESAFTVVRHRGGQIYKWQVTFWRQNPERPPFPV